MRPIARHLMAGLVALGGSSPTLATELLVPAYFYPSFDPAQSQWTELTAAVAAGARITLIANVFNGPGTQPNSDYTNAINAFRAAGGHVLGYVYTCYGGTQCAEGLPPQRSVDEVLADAQRWAQWYTVDGIFLDEMANTAALLPFYTQVANGLRGTQAGWSIFGNPGTAAPSDYLTVADTLVTFENGTGSYAGAASEPWMAATDPRRQAHLHYNVTGADAMLSLLAQARARNAGYVYITDDRFTPNNPTEPNPWDQLPTYLGQELQAAAAVPEPSSLLLALAGIGVICLRLQRPR
jgi:Spherulation-specific family 4/PEP-CTERM motif